VLLGAIWVMGVSTLTTYADGPGGHGDDPYAWIRAGGYESQENTLFDEASFDWTWGTSPVVGSAYALGDIRSSDSAIAKARSVLYYHDPYGSGKLSIGADVETYRPFLVSSTSLAPGTTVSVSLTIHYDGTLQALEGTEEKYSYARATGAMTLYDSLGSLLSSRMGRAEVECELVDGEMEFSTETLGAWQGLLTKSSNARGDLYVLHYEDQISFTATVGSVYWLYFDLATSATSSSGDGSGWGQQTFAMVDFSNTGTYTLSSSDDVAFVTVPEPSSLLLVVLGGLAVLRQRRREDG